MKTKKIISVSRALTLFIVLSAVAALAATTASILYQKKGISEFRFLQHPGTGGRVVETLRNDYEVRRLYNVSTGEDELYLISSQKKHLMYFDAEGVDGMINWEVRRGSKFQNILWSKSEQATELNVHGSQPLLVTGLQGCCAELTGYRMYDLRSGKLMMSFNDFSYDGTVVRQPFSLEVPNSPLVLRYIGVISQDSTRDRDFVAPVAGKQAAVIVKYANEALRQKIQFDISVAPGYGISVMEVTLEKDPSAAESDKIEFRGKESILWNIDGATAPAAIEGVQLKIVLNAGEGDKTLIIPVKNDRLDLSRATVPAGVRINAQQ